MTASAPKKGVSLLFFIGVPHRRPRAVVFRGAGLEQGSGRAQAIAPSRVFGVSGWLREHLVRWAMAVRPETDIGDDPFARGLTPFEGRAAEMGQGN